MGVNTTTTAFIAFGSNLGEKQRNILNALALINGLEGISVCRCSSIYESLPLGGIDQPNYLNGVVEIETSLAPTALLDKLKKIENQLGRADHCQKWQARNIDLDIVFYGDQIVDTPLLKVPHPEAHLRSFVLKGICELEGDKKHPVLNMTCSRLYERLGDGDFYLDSNRPQLIEMAGTIGAGKSTLAKGLVRKFNAEFLKEKYDENPYLSMVYEGREDLALKSELFFLDNSLSQLDKDKLEQGKVYITDYIFEKSAIYPKFWLSEDDYEIFIQHYKHSLKLAAEPVLVIDIIDTPQNCLNRVRSRKRRYEQDIKPEFLEALTRDYEDMLKSWKKSPVITINADEIDLRDEKAIEAVYNDIRHYVLSD